jgi:hypothetical protein
MRFVAHFPSVTFLTFPPQLPDSIKEFYHEHYGVYPTDSVLAHLKRELIHASLRLIFHGPFADAQKNGQITRCADDIVRRWLLQLIFHSSDYPEKCECFSFYLPSLPHQHIQVSTHMHEGQRMVSLPEVSHHQGGHSSDRH